MWLLDQLAEERIEQARRRGDLDDLPTAGRPLDLDDDSMVPAELRAGYRLLKNAGYLPEEMQARRDIHDAEELLRLARDEDERQVAAARLRLLMDRLDRRRGATLVTQEAYYRRICERVR
ncbi:MAG: DnaJ family domain-containing protein [Halofilum sp. (in: g-proteobacteria)]|nr:DnaJ family domain-containing protein [Halofilum sp. (in: g-proteobacteria)]